MSGEARGAGAALLRAMLCAAEPFYAASAAARNWTFDAGLHDRPEVDAIILDDGFQHRRLARDLDIVLLNAANPFGYDHVLPRGMLREPPRGIARGGAIILTHSDQASGDQLNAIENRINRY